MAGVVFLRFPPLLRAWAVLLVAVNALSILFIQSVYAQVALAAVTIGVIIMAVIHARLGYVRLLGIGHILWIPMLPWLVCELSNVDHDSWLYWWLVCLIVLNSICLTVDTIDVVRFLRGERDPHYVWERENPV